MRGTTTTALYLGRFPSLYVPAGPLPLSASSGLEKARGSIHDPDSIPHDFFLVNGRGGEATFVPRFHTLPSPALRSEAPPRPELDLTLERSTERRPPAPRECKQYYSSCTTRADVTRPSLRYTSKPHRSRPKKKMVASTRRTSISRPSTSYTGHSPLTCSVDPSSRCSYASEPRRLMRRPGTWGERL